MDVSRRDLLRLFGTTVGMAAFGKRALGGAMMQKKITADAEVSVCRAVGGRPDENIEKVIQLSGGIENIVGQDDIVIVKPNVQWWNQGAPNLSAVNCFVEMVFERQGGFKGEVVIAENCHRGREPWKSASSGWIPKFDRNSDLDAERNFNDLSTRLKRRFRDRFSTCHWVDADAGGRRVFGAGEGPGYIYCDGSGGVPLIKFDNGTEGDGFRSVIMTYPVFRTDTGTVVDLKNGVWQKGAYTDQPLKLINFAALNHHSTYCGFTSCIKNYLGVTDLSGGPDPHDNGNLTDNSYNFHSFPFNKWAPGPVPGMIGAEIGVFMNTIRKADLNIVSAEWIGLSSRTDAPVVRTRAVLASTDPVALDYHSAKYILYPNSRIKYHNPDDPQSPAYQYLKGASEHGGGILDESRVAVRSFDVAAGRFQRDDDLAVVLGDKEWGTNPKAILKYMVLRSGLLS